MSEELSGEFHLLDKAKWKEIPGKACTTSGNIYVGRDFGKPVYEFRVYYKEVKSNDSSDSLVVSASKKR